jgi:hypothetical protein
MKYLKQTTSYREKPECWLPRLGREEAGMVFDGEKSSGDGWCDSYTTVSTIYTAKLYT